MSKRIIYFVLVVVVLIAAVMRFAWLGQVPIGVTPDEIQQGYSAYSILQTGHDEWGDFLPIFPRSFGDYRPPLYVYLTVPSVALFDLNMFAVRFPSALFGVLSVLMLFVLVDELFRNEQKPLLSKQIALLASIILTISSWHLFYSRAAWESNVTIFFFMMGLWLFLKGFRLKRKVFLGLSAVSFGLTMFGYYSFQLFTPLFVSGLLVLKFVQTGDIKEIFKKKELVSFAVIFGLFVALLAYGQLFTGAGRRASDAAIYNSENLSALREKQVNDPLPQPWGRVINNRLAYLGSQFSQNYLGYFSTTFLASPDRSDSSLYNLPGQWLLSVWEILFILSGIFALFKLKIAQSRIIFLWLLVAPIPAALTRNYMHTQRVEVLLLLFPVLAALGIYWVFSLLKNIKGLQFGFVGILMVVMVYSLVARIDFYAFHQFERPLGGVHYNYEEIFKFAEQNKDKYDQVLFTQSQGQPQIYLAFYTKMDPTYFQSQSQNWKDFEKEFKFLDQTEYTLGKYYFKKMGWDIDKYKKNTMIIGGESETPDGVKADKTFKDPFDKIMFRVFDTNNEL